MRQVPDMFAVIIDWNLVTSQNQLLQVWQPLHKYPQGLVVQFFILRMLSPSSSDHTKLLLGAQFEGDLSPAGTSLHQN